MKEQTRELVTTKQTTLRFINPENVTIKNGKKFAKGITRVYLLELAEINKGDKYIDTRNGKKVIRVHTKSSPFFNQHCERIVATNDRNVNKIRRVKCDCRKGNLDKCVECDERGKKVLYDLPSIPNFFLKLLEKEYIKEFAQIHVEVNDYGLPVLDNRTHTIRLIKK